MEIDLPSPTNMNKLEIHSHSRDIPLKKTTLAKLEKNYELSVSMQYAVSPRCTIHCHDFYCLRYNKGCKG